MTRGDEPLGTATAAVEAFCKARIPEDLRDEIRLEVSRRGRSITINERRPPWDPGRAGEEWTSSPVAQLRQDPAPGTWSLYYPDRNGRWWPYEGIGPTGAVDSLLAEIDRDPTGIFWG